MLQTVLLAGTADAQAATLDARIEVERAPAARDCPGSGELAVQVENILQRPLRTGSGADVRVDVTFERPRDEYHAKLRLRGAKSGERVLRDPSNECGPLAEAVSVTIALLLDRDAQIEAVEEERRPPETTSDDTGATDAAADTTAPETTADEASSDEARGSLGLLSTFEVGAAFGRGSETSAEVAGFVGPVFRRFRLQAGFGAVLPATQSFQQGEVRTGSIYGVLRACYVAGARVALGLCAAAGVGRLEGTGVGYAEERETSLWWTAVGPGFVAEWAIGEWAHVGRALVGASGVLWFPTRTQTLVIENVGTAWESPSVQGNIALLLGFEVF